MPSGWTRWLFEQFEFPFEVVYPQMLDAGDLNKRFDVLVFVDGAIPARDLGAAFVYDSAGGRRRPDFDGVIGRARVDGAVGRSSRRRAACSRAS